MNLCILYGGKSNEREVSMASLELVLKNLSTEKYNIELVELPADGGNAWAKEMAANPPDVVFSALHGGSGENGAVQGFLECLNIPYAGSKVLSSALCMNKHLSKIVMERHHIPCAEGRLIKAPGEFNDFDGIIVEFGLPVVVKPNNGGSSIGVTIAKDKDGMASACKAIFDMGDFALIEKYYQGREITCGIIERGGKPEIIGILDIVPVNEFYDYEAKYADENTYIGLSDLPGFLLSMIEEISKKAFTVLGCEGYGRLDMLIINEQVVVIEMNTLPGLTAHSLIPKAAESLQGGFSGLLDMLIEEAVNGKTGCIGLSK